MRTILLGLAAVAPAMLVTPALAQDGPTFGQAMANVLGIQQNDYCNNIVAQSTAWLQSYLARTPTSEQVTLSERFAGAAGYNLSTNYGAYIPDVDEDGVADAEEYVRIASIYGAGFYYIPGTDTCIKIGGFVRFQGDYESPDFVGGSTRAAVSIDTRTQTAYGTLRTFVQFNGVIGGGFGGGGGFGWGYENWFDPIFVQFSGLDIAGHRTTITAGRLSSAYDFGPGYTYYGGPQSEATVLQVRGTVLLDNGLAADVAIERGGDRGNYGYPALVVGIGPADTMAWRASAALTGTPFGPGFAVQFGTGFNINPRLSLRAVGAVALNVPTYAGLCCTNDGLFVSALVSGRYQTGTPYDITGAIGVGFGDGDRQLQTTIGVVRDLAPNVTFGAELSHWTNFVGGRELEATIRLQRSFYP